MKYKQSIIDIYGENNIKSFLQSGVYVDKFPFTIKETNKKNALEHYIVKHYSTEQDPQLKKAMASFLDDIKQLVLYNPFYASDFYICKPGIIQEMYSKSELDDLSRVINEMYKKAADIYNKFKSGNKLTSGEKFSLSSFFIYTYDNANEQIKTARMEYIKSLLQENKMPQTKQELELVLKYASDFALGKYNIKISPDIVLTRFDGDKKNGWGYQQGDEIYINYINRSSLADFICTVCHETRHVIQDYMSKHDPESCYSLYYAMQQIFPYDEYHKNYKFNEIEEDANRHGYHDCFSIYYQNGFVDIARQVKEKEEKSFDDRHFEYEYANILDQSGEFKQYMSKERYNVLRLNDAIKRNPKYIDKYPVLGKLYNKDGSPKELAELLCASFALNDDRRKIYEDHIYTYIRNGKLSEIDFQSFDEENKRYIRGQLISIYATEAKKVIKIIKENKFRESRNPDLVKKIITYRLDILDRIGQFMDQNSYELCIDDEKMQTMDGNTRHVSYLVSSYISDVKNLLALVKSSSENIPEYAKPYIKQIQEYYKRMMITQAFVYIVNKLQNYTSEELKTPVTLENGNKISFKQYAEEVIASSAEKGRNTYFIVESGESLSLRKYLDKVLNDAKIQMQEETKQNSYQSNLNDREQALLVREECVAKGETEIQQAEKQLQVKRAELEQLQKELEKREQSLLVREQALSEKENGSNNHTSFHTEELLDMAKQIIEQYNRENQQRQYTSQSNGKSI